MNDKNRDDAPEPDDKQPEQEVVSDFDGVRLRSKFRIVEEEPGKLSFSIEGPVFDFDLDDEDPEEEEDKP